jgi:hypothetical protein
MTTPKMVIFAAATLLAAESPLAAADFLYKAALVPTPFGDEAAGGMRYIFKTDPPDAGPVSLSLLLQNVPTDEVWVWADNQLIGVIDLTDGAGELLLVRANGDEVPTLVAGDGIVATDANGVALLVGVLTRR